MCSSDLGKIKKLVERDTLRELQVIYTDPEGYVWLGTFGGGLVLWKDGKPTRITMQDGLPDGQIFDMLADGPDRFWIACSSGYYSVSRKNLLDFASGRVKKITGTAFNSTLRLRTIESQADVTPAVWKSHDGQLWFSTIRGLLRFDPARWNQESGPMQPVIDEVEVSGEVVKPGDIERLPPGNNNVTFHYTALSLLHPEQWRFQIGRAHV